MLLPKYHELYGPILRLLENGKTYSTEEVKRQVAEVLGLSESDMEYRSSGGKQPLFDYRFKRACSDLYKTGFIDRPHRGQLRITDDGKRAAKEVRSDDPNEWRVVYAFNEMQRLGAELKAIHSGEKPVPPKRGKGNG